MENETQDQAVSYAAPSGPIDLDGESILTIHELLGVIRSEVRTTPTEIVDAATRALNAVVGLRLSMRSY